MTKQKFLEVLAEQIRAYPWASDSAKFERYMCAARDTLNGGNFCDRSGAAWKAAFEACGMTGARNQTLKALHKLPN